MNKKSKTPSQEIAAPAAAVGAGRRFEVWGRRLRRRNETSRLAVGRPSCGHCPFLRCSDSMFSRNSGETLEKVGRNSVKLWRDYE